MRPIYAHAQEQTEQAKNKSPITLPHRSIVAPLGADLHRDHPGHLADNREHDNQNDPEEIQAGNQGHGQVNGRTGKHTAALVEKSASPTLHAVLAPQKAVNPMRGMRTKSATGMSSIG